MSSDTLTALAALIGAVTGVASLVITWRRNRAAARRDEVEVLRGVIAELRSRVVELEQEVELWRTRYNQLVERIRQLGVILDDYRHQCT